MGRDIGLYLEPEFDMADRNRATQLSLVGGMLGRNIAGVALIAAVANQGRPGGGRPAPGIPPAPLPRPQTPARVQVPEVGDPLEQAEETIREVGLLPRVEGVVSEENLDHVMGTDPQAGTIVRRGGTVVIYVSAGVLVPDVTGKQLDEAEKLLEEDGFGHETDDAKQRGKENVVARQEPSGGDYADYGSVVTLFLFTPPRRREELRAVEGKREK